MWEVGDAISGEIVQETTRHIERMLRRSVSLKGRERMKAKGSESQMSGCGQVIKGADNPKREACILLVTKFWKRRSYLYFRNRTRELWLKEAEANGRERNRLDSMGSHSKASIVGRKQRWKIRAILEAEETACDEQLDLVNREWCVGEFSVYSFET